MIQIVILTAVISTLVTFVLTCLCLKYIQNKRREDKSKKESTEKTVMGANLKHEETKSSYASNVRQKTEASSVDVESSNATIEEVVPIDRKLSKKEQKKLLRKEERTQKKQEDLGHKAEVAEEELRRKKSFDPFKSKPESVTYEALAVSDSKLTPCEIGQTQYYRCWKYEGRVFFEFYCDKSKAGKAINNRSVILDPFCVKNPSSVPVDSAKSMVIEKFGEIDSNYNILSKSQIKFE